MRLSAPSFSTSASTSDCQARICSATWARRSLDARESARPSSRATPAGSVRQAECARYIADRGIDVDRIFTHRWRLDQAEEAYRVFDAQNSGKGVILPN